MSLLPFPVPSKDPEFCPPLLNHSSLENSHVSAQCMYFKENNIFKRKQLLLTVFVRFRSNQETMKIKKSCNFFKKKKALKISVSIYAGLMRIAIGIKQQHFI